jgi:hypothetical protein
MNTPCRISIEERNHDMKQVDAEDFNDSVNAEARELAQALIESAPDVQELIGDYSEIMAVPIARIMREFDQAAVGNTIARNACLNAISTIQRGLFTVALEKVREQAVRNVEARDTATGE